MSKHFLLCCVVLFSTATFAQETIENIIIEGNIRHSERTIRSYFSFEPGDTFDSDTLKQITRSLFVSEFFSHVALYRDLNNLIIEVTERPWISEMRVGGNELIDKEQMASFLELQNISENRSFNQDIFEKITQEIKNQYYLLGYYGVQVAASTEPLDGNRIRLIIQIYEGEVSRIVRINLIGNNSYQQSDLVRLFQTRQEHPENLFNNNDHYLRSILEGDIQRLRNFYLDRGYARVRIVDQYVSQLPDKSGVFISVQLEEGSIYQISGVKIAGHEKVFTDKQIKQFNKIKTNETFSQRNIVETIENIRRALQNQGYAFAQITPITTFNEENKTVFLNININTNQRVYVRRIIFSGNNITLDHVVRREMRQLEGALYSPVKVAISKNRLNRLGFFENVDTQELPVNEQLVDLLILTQDKRTGSLNASIGYSPQQGAIYKLSIAESNWLGRGYNTKIELDYQDDSEAITFHVKNNYFTDDNVSLLWNVSYRRTTAENLGTRNYIIDSASSNLIFGIPYSENIKINYGLGAVSDTISCNPDFLVCTNYVDAEGEENQSALLQISGDLDRRNRAFLPSSGSYHSVSSSVSAPEIGISYYSMNFKSQWYYALSKSTRNTLRLKGSMNLTDGYNDDTLPFYKNFFTGGIYTVRGFSNGSLGERYNEDIDGTDAYRGGKLRTFFNLDSYIAVTGKDEFSKEPDTFRLNIFIDGGYSFREVSDFDPDAWRFSLGSGVVYFSPLGIISIFYALPINEQDSDDIEQFGFSLNSQL